MSETNDYRAGMELGYLLFARLDGSTLEGIASAFDGSPETSEYNQGVLEALGDSNSAHHDRYGTFKMWSDMGKVVVR